MFTNINDAIEWVTKRRNETKDFESFKKIIAKLNNPQNDFKTIHVGGTNGKGSTVTFLRDILIEHGYNVGTLQSPHYISHLDRIRYNGNNIEDEAFLRLLNEYYDFFVDNQLNMFEIDFIIMCMYFKEKNVDYAIVEVGIGGRLDSTNVIGKPLLSIIVTVGYDHMDRLGDSLEKICMEKCGIIKNNSNVLVGHLNDDLKKIVHNEAIGKNANYFELEDYAVVSESTFEYFNEDYKISSLAYYQLHNAALALKAFNILCNVENIKCDKTKVKKALLESKWDGRFDIISENPRVILDGAHNIDGIKALKESVSHLSGSKAILFAALKTKEYQKMIEELKIVADKLVLTTFSYPLACKEEDYQSSDYNSDYVLAYQELIKNYDNIIIAGSLYFISDFVQVVLKSVK